MDVFLASDKQMDFRILSSERLTYQAQETTLVSTMRCLDVIPNDPVMVDRLQLVLWLLLVIANYYLNDIKYIDVDCMVC